MRLSTVSLTVMAMLAVTAAPALAQTGALPATLIYDKTGKEVARLPMPAEWDSPEAIALVQAVLDGKS